MTYPEKTLALGNFTPEDLVVSVHDSNRTIDPELEARVDASWEEMKRKAEREGRVCYNGISYRLNNFREEAGKLHVEFGLLEYKARQALHAIHEYFALPEQYQHLGCFTGATVKTADGKYLVVELSGKSMNTFPFDMLGGIMEKPQEIENGNDVFTTLLVELEEEARIKWGDIKDLYLRGIFVTHNAHTCFYFEAILNVTSQELLERFEKETEDQDIKALKALSEEEYAAFLKNHKSPTKQLIAGARHI